MKIKKRLLYCAVIFFSAAVILGLVLLALKGHTEMSSWGYYGESDGLTMPLWFCCMPFGFLLLSAGFYTQRNIIKMIGCAFLGLILLIRAVGVFAPVMDNDPFVSIVELERVYRSFTALAYLLFAIFFVVYAIKQEKESKFNALIKISNIMMALSSMLFLFLGILSAFLFYGDELFPVPFSDSFFIIAFSLVDFCFNIFMFLYFKNAKLYAYYLNNPDKLPAGQQEEVYTNQF